MIPSTDSTSDPVPARMEAVLSSEGISLTILDQQGDLLRKQWLEARSNRVERKGHLLLEWAVHPESDSSGSILARILLAGGQPPLVRTRLPESIGLPGGRYDLQACGPLPKASAIAAS